MQIIHIIMWLLNGSEILKSTPSKLPTPLRTMKNKEIRVVFTLQHANYYQGLYNILIRIGGTIKYDMERLIKLREVVGIAPADRMKYVLTFLPPWVLNTVTIPQLCEYQE